ncbi:MAG: hypothetical protein P1Q69_13565 [Candidatus Thorarchaeota archaeon]|nr:hypothetical protein [Candidatus Thorarchaeota archaeon]
MYKEITPDGISKENSVQHTKRKVLSLGFLGILSITWLAFRSGTKPSRFVYPCQMAAFSNLQLVALGIFSSIPSLTKVRSKIDMLKPLFILSAVILGSLFLTSDPGLLNASSILVDDDYNRVPIVLNPSLSTAIENTSDLFFVQNATGVEGDMDPAVASLISLMNSEDLQFYQSASNPLGLIGSSDVVLIKYNAQWNYRGGTNTDLIKSVIQAILDHPDRFIVEIVVADNGQGIGALDFPSANAFNRSQCLTEVVESFSTTKIFVLLMHVLELKDGTVPGQENSEQ